MDPSPVVLGENTTFTCNVSSNVAGIDVNATIQWLSTDNTVLEQSGPNAESLDLDFEPFEQSNIGDYTCTAQVSSPDLPSGLMTFLSRTLFYARKIQFLSQQLLLYSEFFFLINQKNQQ